MTAVCRSGFWEDLHIFDMINALHFGCHFSVQMLKINHIFFKFLGLSQEPLGQ